MEGPVEDLEPVDPGEQPVDELAEPGEGPVEDPVEDLVEEPGRRRRYPSTIGGAFYLVVLAVAAFGLWVVADGDWRVGVRWIGGSLVFAAVVRLVLPRDDAGMLAVRHRLVDVTLLAAVGVALWLLSLSIPNQPPL